MPAYMHIWFSFCLNLILYVISTSGKGCHSTYLDLPLKSLNCAWTWLTAAETSSTGMTPHADTRNWVTSAYNNDNTTVIRISPNISNILTETCNACVAAILYAHINMLYTVSLCYKQELNHLRPRRCLKITHSHSVHKKCYLCKTRE